MSLRKRIAVLLSALSIMVVLAVPPVMADPVGGFTGGTAGNEGNKSDDGLDKNKGGGQEKPKNGRRKNGQFEDVVVAQERPVRGSSGSV